MKRTHSFLLTASVCLAITFTLSCEIQAADQKDFYGVWFGYINGAPGFCEINKDAMIMISVNGEKAINRIVKWEKNNNDQSYIIYVLTKNNQKMSIPIDIDAYSDLKLSFGPVAYEFKKSSQAELDKAIRPAEQAKAEGEKAKVDAKASQSSFTDTRDKKTYKTVKIGSQVWMAQNLDYNAKGSKCHQNQDVNCNKYGRLYDWNTAKKSCPSGWHLPSKAEWEKLTDFIGGEKIAGKKLKSNSGWKENGNGTDEFGFSALPGGGGNSDGNFGGVGYSGNWWSASENEDFSDIAYRRYMGYNYEAVGRDSINKSDLNSVRCLQD